LLWLKPVHDVVDFNGLYTQALIVLSTAAIGVMGIPFTTQGSLIHLPSISLNVEFGCNGLDAVLLYCIAVLAFPAPWKKKVLGIIGGSLVIQIINVLRIAALAYSGVHHKEIFEYVHLFVAQGIMIAVDFAIFLIYLDYAERGKRAVS
jgi:exosortase H (IPTLxxWG-CTERM-specific)